METITNDYPSKTDVTFTRPSTTIGYRTSVIEKVK